MNLNGSSMVPETWERLTSSTLCFDCVIGFYSVAVHIFVLEKWVGNVLESPGNRPPEFCASPVVYNSHVLRPELDAWLNGERDVFQCS